jgi:hypothetical protein
MKSGGKHINAAIYAPNYCVFELCPKPKNRVIQSVLHHRQSPLESTSNVYGILCTMYNFIAQTTIAPRKYIFTYYVGTRTISMV